ncbi:BcsE family c-di-GMP-binding protein [Vibrio parahaemolyticus]|nr:BcsE family c-di-GMP-binding protein [Vibrio parahaemolyticus]
MFTSLPYSKRWRRCDSLQKALYVLFSAIRQSDIDIALNNIFEFPVRDLFHSTHTFDTQLDIETELKFIVQDEAVISDDVSTLTTERKYSIPPPIPWLMFPSVCCQKGH